MTNLKIIANKKLEIDPFSLQYNKYSEGQLNTLLLARNYELLGAYRNDSNLSGLSKFIKSNISPNKDFYEFPKVRNNWVNNYIDKQKSKHWISIAGSYFDQSNNAARVGDPATFAEWLEAEKQACLDALDEWQGTSFLRFTRRAQLRKAYEACSERVYYVRMLNNKLESASYQPLYNFVRGNSDPVRVITKSVLHTNFVTTISLVTGLSYETVSLWVRNGVLANGMAGGVGDMQPEESIDFFRENKGKPLDSSAIGDPATVTAMVILIVKLIAAALPAVIALINAFKSNDKARILAASESVGSASWGAQNEDWLGFQDGVGSTDLMFLLGGYLLYDQLTK